MKRGLLVFAVVVGALVTIGLVSDRYEAKEAVARKERAAREAEAQAESDRAMKQALEERAAKFSPADYAADLKSAEARVKRNEFQAAAGHLGRIRSELSWVLKSSRATEPAIIAFAERLDAREHALSAAMDREAAAAKERNTVQAARLYEQFTENEIRANSLKGQRLRVKGRISNIGTDILGTPYIAFTTDAIIFSVQAMFNKDDEPMLAKLNQGQQVAVSCVVDGKLGNVILRQCALD